MWIDIFLYFIYQNFISRWITLRAFIYICEKVNNTQMMYYMIVDGSVTLEIGFLYLLYLGHSVIRDWKPKLMEEDAEATYDENQVDMTGRIIHVTQGVLKLISDKISSGLLSFIKMRLFWCL